MVCKCQQIFWNADMTFDPKAKVIKGHGQNTYNLSIWSVMKTYLNASGSYLVWWYDLGEKRLGQKNMSY